LVEVVFEAIEVRGPELATRREPLIELFERLGSYAIEALRVRARLDQAGVLEDAKVLGHSGLTEADAVDELADGALAFAKQVEDLKSAGSASTWSAARLRTSASHYLAVICLSRNGSFKTDPQPPPSTSRSPTAPRP
jgi:hypothetical protein